MRVTFAPLTLAAGLKDPPAGLIFQVTPAASLVVAESDKLCVTVSPARFSDSDTESAAELTVSVRFTEAFCTGLPESWTWKVSGVLLTTAPGTPVIAPVWAFKESPRGNVPDVTVHEKGWVPPLAGKLAE